MPQRSPPLSSLSNACQAIRSSCVLTLLLAGCTNAPGALSTHLRSEKQSFTPGEPILLHATLSTHSRPVCLAGEWTAFAGELTCDERPDRAKSTRKQVFCGTALAVLLPIAPLIVPVLLFDVGDALGRFIVIPPAGSKTYHLVMIPTAQGIILTTAENAGNLAYPPDKELLPSGRYHLKVRFLHRGSLPPLFWKPYGHPICAETEFVIAPSPQRDGVAEEPGS